MLAEKIEECTVTYESGSFSFVLERNWVKWPVDIDNMAVSGIAAGDDDLVYVSTRSKNYPICVFDHTGKLVKSFGEKLEFKRTHGLSIDLDGNIWICDDQNSIIYHLDREGNVINVLGEKGYFSDSGYDPSLRWPHDIYTNKRAAEPFNRPTKLIQSPWEDLYCTDGYGNTAIHRFTKEGVLLKTWGGPGNEPGKFRLPHSIAIDTKERLWICDRENFMVQIYDKEGNYISRIERLLYPSEIWSCGENMYLCEGDGQISIFDMKMKKVAEIGYPGCFERIHSIAGDAKGNIYLGRIEGADSLFRLTRR